MKGRACIAMSGGVDSSTAAWLMQKAGYDCMGVTMRLFHNEDACISRERSCCSLDDVEDAKSVAHRLGIPFYVFDFTADFKRHVIDRFVAAYEGGATPNPCIDCNRYLKFERLYHRAMALGCEVVVTGHYARIEKQAGRFLLKKALDVTKDQSYVLYTLTQEQLAHMQFPLGGLKKEEVRQLARKQRFLNADKRDSQDICFVPDGDYAKVIEHHTGRSYPPGDILDRTGQVLGRHEGIIRYTIGQRKGLKLALQEPMYVCRKCIADNTIVLGRQADLLSREIDARDVHWIACECPGQPLRLKARIRYKQAEQWATVTPTGPDSVHLTFDEPQRAAAKGQAVVWYDGDIVVGGGTIC